MNTGLSVVNSAAAPEASRIGEGSQFLAFGRLGHELEREQVEIGDFYGAAQRLVPPSTWMRRVLRIAIAALLVVAALPAFAHDLVRRSTPASGAIVAPGALSIAIEFSGKIDKPLSEITLRGANGAPRILAMTANSTPNLLTAQPIELSPGDYVIRWTVMSSDGHLTRGDIRFKCAPAP